MRAELNELELVKDMIKRCLTEVYTQDAILFSRNVNTRGVSEGVCERCIVFRFAHYLQKEIDIHYSDYKVDCDYDSSFIFNLDDGNSTPDTKKRIPYEDGTELDRSRYVDIIVHKRNDDLSSDFFCFEFKKWNRGTPEERAEDIHKIKHLTSTYNYQYGFFLDFGADKETTKWTIYQREHLNRVHIDNELVFRD